MLLQNIFIWIAIPKNPRSSTSTKFQEIDDGTTWQVVDIYYSLRLTATLRVDIADPVIANSSAAVSQALV
jgi:hypothetical protein